MLLAMASPIDVSACPGEVLSGSWLLHMLATPSRSPQAVRGAGAKAHLDWHGEVRVLESITAIQQSSKLCLWLPKKLCSGAWRRRRGDAVPSNCMCAAAGAVSGRAAAYRSWKGISRRLLERLPRYKPPRKLALLSLRRSPARIHASCHPSSHQPQPPLFLPRHRRAARPQLQLTPPDAVSAQLQSSPFLAQLRAAPLTCTLTLRLGPSQHNRRYPCTAREADVKELRLTPHHHPPPPNVPPSRLL